MSGHMKEPRAARTAGATAEQPVTRFDMTKPSNTITSPEQMADLPAGQWALSDDGRAYCLFDTHIGWPQRMWGSKPDGGTKGYVQSFVALDAAPLPLRLGDVEGSNCQHRRSNECGQCLGCGLPGAGESRPALLGDEAAQMLQGVAAHNGRIEASL